MTAGSPDDEEATTFLLPADRPLVRRTSPVIRRLLLVFAVCACAGVLVSLAPAATVALRSSSASQATRVEWGLLDETLAPIFWPAPWDDMRFSFLNAAVRSQADTFRDESAAPRFLEALVFFEGAAACAPGTADASRAAAEANTEPMAVGAR